MKGLVQESALTVVTLALCEDEGPPGIQVRPSCVPIAEDVGVPDRHGPRSFQNELIVVTENEDEADLFSHAPGQRE